MKLKNDFFWRCYLKSFECPDDAGVGETPVTPSNFCVYFWRGLLGLFMLTIESIYNFFVRTPMWVFPLLAVVASLPALLIPSSYAGNNSVLYPVVLTSLLATIFAFAGPIKFVLWSWNRLVARYTSEVVQSRILWLLCGLMMWGLMCVILNVPILAAKFGMLVLVLPLVIGSALLASLTGTVLFVGIAWLCGHAASVSFVRNCLTYCGSLKKHICPVVEPPDEFIKQEKNGDKCTTSGNS